MVRITIYTITIYTWQKMVNQIRLELVNVSGFYNSDSSKEQDYSGEAVPS